MKMSFYYVDERYIDYLKKTEIKYRGFTTVPNVKYANARKFVYGTVLTVGKYNYYVPVSSYNKPQEDNLVIRIKDKYQIGSFWIRNIVSAKLKDQLYRNRQKGHTNGYCLVETES